MGNHFFSTPIEITSAILHLALTAMSWVSLHSYLILRDIKNLTTPSAWKMSSQDRSWHITLSRLSGLSPISMRWMKYWHGKKLIWEAFFHFQVKRTLQSNPAVCQYHTGSCHYNQFCLALLLWSELEMKPEAFCHTCQEKRKKKIAKKTDLGFPKL